MRHFKDMVKHVRLNGLFHDHNKMFEKLFYEVVSKCEVFVFEKVEGDPLHMENLHTEGSEVIDAPFEIFSIEIANGFITVPNDDNGEKAVIKCLIFSEPQDRTLSPPMLFSFLSVRGRDVVIASAKYDDEWGSGLIKIINLMLERLSKEKDGVEYVSDVVMIKNGNKKVPHPIRRIFHVCSKSKINKIYENSGREIDWSHRWWVRGHWMNFYKEGTTEIDMNRLGKDRKGEYCVYGKTWRSHYEKGPEDKPIIKKVRVVDSQKE